MSRYNSSTEDFKKKTGPWIQWHIKVIGEKNNVQHNEAVESGLGIDVNKRTLAPPAPQPGSSNTTA